MTTRLFTVIEGSDATPLSKSIRYANHELKKSPLRFSKHYRAKTHAGGLGELHKLLKNPPDNGCAIITGYATEKTNRHFDILSKDAFKKAHPQVESPYRIETADYLKTCARAKDNFKPGNLILFDADFDEHAPEHLRKMSHEELFALYCAIWPGFKGVGYVAMPSVSSNIRTIEGNQRLTDSRWHLYFQVRAASDIPRFVENFEAQCWLQGFGWFVETEDGKKLPKTLFDPQAISPERICFEADPVLGRGIYQTRRRSVQVRGTVINTKDIPDLSPAEIPHYATLRGHSLIDGSISGHHENSLQWDTPIKLSDGRKTTPREFYASDAEKIPCFSPFRQEEHPSAFIARRNDNTPFVYDSATDTRYAIDFSQPKTPEGQLAQVLVSSDFPCIKTTAKGRVVQIHSYYANLEHLVNQYNITLRYNVISKKFDFKIPGLKTTRDNELEICFGVVRDLCLRNNLKIPIHDTRGMILRYADEHEFNPVKAWIASKPWDGASRISQFLNSVSSTNEELKNLLIFRWMISAIAFGVSEKGIKNEAVLVFSGPQGIGKTNWFKNLAPKELTLDGATLNPHDKDSVIQVIQRWLVELGELDATFKKADLAALRSFFSKDEDEVRRPFAAASSCYPRRTAFFASVNPEYFLTDNTGNRRYWALRVTRIKLDKKLDMQQVWAEFHQLYQDGEPYRLTQKEYAMVEEYNERHEAPDPIAEAIWETFDFGQAKKCVPMTATGVLAHCDINKPTPYQTSRTGTLLGKRFGLKSRRSNGHTIYDMPDFKPGKGKF